MKSFFARSLPPVFSARPALSRLAFALVFLLLTPLSFAADLDISGNVGFQTSSDGSTVVITAGRVENRNSGGTSGGVRLELWAFATPYTGGALTTGYRMAVYSLGQLAGGSARTNVNSGSVPFFSPPQGTWRVSLVATEFAGSASTNDGYVQRDYENFATPWTSGALSGNSSLQFGGRVTYTPTGGNTGVILQVDTLRSLSPSGTSGSLRFELWATSSVYSGGPISGHKLAQYPMSPIAAGSTRSGINSGTIAFTAPPTGTWRVALLLTEYNTGTTANDGYALRDYVTFPDPMVIAGGPTIVTHPVSVTVGAGATATFTVSATPAPLTYQWRKDGVAIPGATSATLTILNAQATNEGAYTVVVSSNTGGSIVSNVATLTVLSGATASGALFSAGNFHTLFIKPDGTLWGAGANNFGQLGDGSTTARLSPVQLATGVASVAAANNDYSLFVKNDGSLWATGRNEVGQLGDGSTSNRSTPVQIATGVAQAAAGGGHTFFIKNGGVLWGMGWNNIGQLGDGSTADRLSPVQITSGVATVAAFNQHSVFVKLDGTLWTMGWNSYGQLGDGTNTNQSAPVRVATGVATAVGSVAAGYGHTVFVKADGTLWGMGWGLNGQLGAANLANKTTPVQIAIGVTAVAAGGYHTLFLKTDKTLWAMGSNSEGQLGDGTLIDRHNPVQIATDVTAIAAGYYHSVFKKADGTLWGMGGNPGTLGDGTRIRRPTPVQIGVSSTSGATPNAPPTDISLSANSVSRRSGANALVGTLTTTDPDSTSFTYALTDGIGATDNAAFAISGSTLQVINPAMLPAGAYSVRIQSTDSSGGAFSKAFTITIVDGSAGAKAAAVAYDAGGGQSLFITADNSLWATGWNNSGQLGDGTTTNRNSVVRVATDVESVSAGYRHSLFVKRDGTLWAMGLNASGQLGDGTTTDRSTPVQIATGVAFAVAGSHNSFFVKLDGTLWAMGSNTEGILGDGTTVNRSTPVQVATSVANVSTCDTHTLILKADATLWGVGYNGRGALGSSAAVSQLTPVLIASGVKDAVAGFDFTVFLTSERTLWGMGNGSFGELGASGISSITTPVQIATGVISVGAGLSHTLYVKSDGTLWATGRNHLGQLGDGTTTNRTSPVQIATGVESVSCGLFGTLFKKQDGTWWGMGENGGGALGDGSTVNRSTPVQIRLPASNDKFAHAAVLAGASGQIPGTLFGATREPADPRLSGINLNSSVWYRWTAPHTGSVTFRLSDDVARSSSFIGAFTGSTLETLTRIAGSTLTGSATFHATAGTTYTIMVDQWSGGAFSFTLSWSQTASPIAYLSNLSVLARAGTQSETLTAGITIGSGATPKGVLVRGIGPTLAGFGVGNALEDPLLTITRDNTRLSVNDDWGNSAAISAAAAAVGAFALPESSKDAVILGAGFVPGAYVISLEGKGGATGTGLIEIYDTDRAASITASSTRLINISARTFGGSGADTLIIGFTVAGTGSLRVLVRASGPALAPFGISGAMADPKLELYAAGGVKVDENDNWESATLPLQNSVGAFPFPANSKDAVLVATLNPGSYTAQVIPGGDAAGVALVEVYVIP